jgi:hypothetical protein
MTMDGATTEALEILAAQARRGYGVDVHADRPLSPLQLDILELENTSFKWPGEKISEFRRRHPGVTSLGYGLALLRLLSDRRAYEYDGGRYATTLNRIQRLHAEAEQHRSRLRGDLPGEQ